MATLAAQARTRPGILEATGRTQFDTQVEVNGQPRNNPLQVFAAAPDDPMHMVTFDVGRDGTWPQAPGDIYLGSDGSLALPGAAVGDILTITPPGAQPVELRIAGTVYDPSLAPSPQEQTGHQFPERRDRAGSAEDSGR
jgi:putative ABC transport system permease protein